MSDGRLIDISPLISERLAVWPGDVPYTRQESHAIARGDHLGLSSISTTVHLGAHADAPIHYHGGGQGIAERPLDRYFGPCEVIRVKLVPGERILPMHVPAAPTKSRVLFATGSFPDPDHWNADFCSLSPSLIDLLADCGVKTVGIDTPSIDPQDDAELLSHQRVAAHDMSVLEGLVLDQVEAGIYTLIALPLKLDGADAAPVRAALWRADSGGE